MADVVSVPSAVQHNYTDLQTCVAYFLSAVVFEEIVKLIFLVWVA